MTSTIEVARRREGNLPAESRACRLCGSTTSSFLALGEVPALCNEFRSTAESARAAARGSVELSLCRRCGLIANTAFDDTRFDYSPEYDNALERSATFRRFTEGLAERLVHRYELSDREVVEIGCGSGQFLTTLAELGSNRCRGYDPSFDPRRARVPQRGSVDIRTEPYPAEAGRTADLVVCRHVLEHVADPTGLVRAVRDSLGDRPGTVAYFEVPDATYMLTELAFWDVIHEHRWYFCAPTLRWLFERAGFDVVDIGRGFGDQFLWVEARPAAAMSPPDPDPPDASGLAPALEHFASRFRARVGAWRQRLAGTDPARVAVWGMGAKGVMFLNLVDPAGLVGSAVDINPTKQGRYVPGTGQRVIGPEELAGVDPHLVVVMNPLYRAEVERALAEVGVDAEVQVP